MPPDNSTRTSIHAAGAFGLYFNPDEFVNKIVSCIYKVIMVIYNKPIIHGIYKPRRCTKKDPWLVGLRNNRRFILKFCSAVFVFIAAIATGVGLFMAFSALLEKRNSRR